MSSSFHSNPNTKYNIEYWYELNKIVIEHLYVKCNEISKEYVYELLNE